MGVLSPIRVRCRVFNVLHGRTVDERPEMIEWKSSGSSQPLPLLVPKCCRDRSRSANNNGALEITPGAADFVVRFSKS